MMTLGEALIGRIKNASREGWMLKVYMEEMVTKPGEYGIESYRWVDVAAQHK